MNQSVLGGPDADASRKSNNSFILKLKDSFKEKIGKLKRKKQ
jgi:hypothetical protein